MADSLSQTDRALAFFTEARQALYRRTDRLFGYILPVQWLVAIVVAVVVSPRTWAGAESSPHLHLMAALLLGGVLTAVPTALTWLRPGEAITRYAVSAGQLAMVALLIHLTGGRMETHFYIFVSLAFLVAYADWKVLLPGAAVTAVDHVLRGLFWPESVFGLISSTEWRIVEHALYVVLEVSVLVWVTKLSTRDQRAAADLRAEAEARSAELDKALEVIEAEKHDADVQREAAVTLSEESEAQRSALERDVERMLVAMRAFASGDLTVQTHGAETLSRLFEAFNESVGQVREMIVAVEKSVADADAATAEISVATDQLSAAAQEQSSQAYEVSASVEEMSATVVQNARAASETAAAATTNGEAAERGGAVVAETVDKIREIADVVGSSAETVERLGASSERIGQIASTIEDIADQTNLLALNAAIEAARAGEHGRGFAVVADEVRKLAERTTGATQEIGDVLSRIQTEALEAVDSMGRGRARVDEGLDLVDRAGEALREIVAGARQSAHLVSQIASATEEQSATSEQMARSVESISMVSAESARSVGEVSGAADRLRGLTSDLQALVERFSTHADEPTAPDDDRSAFVARPRSQEAHSLVAS